MTSRQISLVVYDSCVSMPKNRFDRVAKELGKEALRSSGTTHVNEEIHPETQYADLSHTPDPADA